jgi:hypothetical protein
MRLLCCIFLLTIFFACTKESLKRDTSLDLALTSQVYVIKEVVNLRGSNSTSSPIIKKLNDGQSVTIIRNINGWYEIYDDELTKGWLRSDMVGPRNLSRTLLATAFVDSILPNYKADIYFDNTDLYKTIYLILPQTYYKSVGKAETYARQIGKKYQEKVYPGSLEVRIMHKNREYLFSRLKLKAIGDANMPVPIIKKGRLLSVDQNNWQIQIYIAVPPEITNSELLEQARSISAKYDLPYSKVEIFQALDSTIGRTNLKNNNLKPENPKICKLYYLEDKDGEYYKYNHCE